MGHRHRFRRITFIDGPRAGCGYKSLVVQENDLLVLSRDKKYLFYMADTENKSSGAPVFNNAWELVGLHVGFEAVSEANRTLNKGIDIAAMYIDIRDNASDTVRTGLDIPR
jgi:hypothetical protein